MSERQLYYGDNLDVLRKYFRDDTIDLCYIDPPFNSKRNYNQIYNNLGKEDQAQAQAFIDTWTWDTRAIEGLDDVCSNSRGILTKQTIELILGLSKVLGKGSLLAYLVSMTLRIAEIWRVLQPTGSFYFHCDHTASHYLKLIADTLFVAHGGDFKNEILWKRTFNAGSSKAMAQKYPTNTDSLLFYTKSDQYCFNKTTRPYSAGALKRYDKVDEQGRRFKWNPLKTVSQARLAELLASGEAMMTSTSKYPVYKHYFHEETGAIVTNLWDDLPYMGTHGSERLGYQTQKPEALLERILKSSSHEDDVVLDAYCGCGTTVAVAERLNRQWKGIDITYQSISVVLKRLEDSFGKSLLQEIRLNGVPQDMASAKALAMKQDDRVRKEFEKWAVLTYTNNRAVIHEKKGGDKGIDGIAFVQETADDYKQVILSVKSGQIQPTMLRDLRGTVEREQAAMGILLTLEPPSRGILQEAKEAGFYRNPLMAGQAFERLQVVTVEDLLAGKRLQLPMTHDVLKKAKSQLRGGQDELFE